MEVMMKMFLGALILISAVGCSHKKEKEVLMPARPEIIQDAVNSQYRTPEYKKRDMYRHPVETLTFFGLKNDMTVIEIWPSGGWYTEILAPYLSEKGKYIMADPAADPNGYTNPRKAWMLAHPEIASTVHQTTFMPNDATKIAEDGTVDLILTFRNVHNWLPLANQEAAFRVFYKALKPGGTLGVVDHRANPKITLDPKSGYVLEKDMIAMAVKAGFKLDGKSEVNANPLDTTDWKEGVWTLPPRLRLGDKDKDKYLSIGESDRMTLKFTKPK